MTERWASVFGMGKRGSTVVEELACGRRPQGSARLLLVTTRLEFCHHLHSGFFHQDCRLCFMPYCCA